MPFPFLKNSLWIGNIDESQTIGQVQLHNDNNCFGEKLKGSLLKGSSDKRMRIDLPVPLPVSSRPPTAPTPFPFPSFSTGKPPPTISPSPRDMNRSSYPFVKTTLIGMCPSTVRPVFPVLVFQLSKQQNRTRTNSSTVLGTPTNRTRTKKFSLEELLGSCFLSWVLNWESTENWDFHRLEPYTKPYSDTVRP